MKSCATCPSRLSEQKVQEQFGKSFGPGVEGCAAIGHVLGRPGLDSGTQAQIFETFAESCPKRAGRATGDQERGSVMTGQTKLLTTPMSVAAPAFNAAATSSSLSKSPLSLVSNVATAAA
jgi:hypothetical protein